MVVSVFGGIEVPGITRIIRLNVEPETVDNDIRAIDVGEIIFELAFHRLARTTSTIVLVAST